MKKGINKTIGANISLASFFLAAALHAALFGGLAALSGASGQEESRKITDRTKTKSPVSVTIIPEISNRGKKSVIKEKKAGKNKTIDNEEFGMKKAQKARQGADIEKETLEYKNMVKQKLQAARSYPPGAKWKGIEGSVRLVFAIGKEGDLRFAGIDESSGEESLDSGALRTIKKAAPFPALPPAYDGLEMKMHVNIVYRLN